MGPCLCHFELTLMSAGSKGRNKEILVAQRFLAHRHLRSGALGATLGEVTQSRCLSGALVAAGALDTVYGEQGGQVPAGVGSLSMWHLCFLGHLPPASFRPWNQGPDSNHE